MFEHMPRVKYLVVVSLLASAGCRTSMNIVETDTEAETTTEDPTTTTAGETTVGPTTSDPAQTETDSETTSETDTETETETLTDTDSETETETETDSETTGGPVCGDGVIDPEEVCDDGNQMDGDGCSSNCQEADCLVPVTHATIADGIADDTCESVFILTGVYQENLEIPRDVSLIRVGDEPGYISGFGDDSVIHILSGTQVTIAGMIVTGGESSQGAGIHNMGDLVLDNAAVEANLASGDGACGGGVYVGVNGTLLMKQSHIRQNTTRNNGLTSYVRGGGACIEDGSLTLTLGSSVSENVLELSGTSNTQTLGGGVYASGATVSILDDSFVSDNKLELIENQESGRGVGGGLALFNSLLEVPDGGEIVNNRVIGSGGPTTYELGGGGVSLDGSTMIMEGGLLSQNQILGETDESVVVRGAGLLLENKSAAVMRGVSVTDNIGMAETTGSQIGVAYSQADGGAAALYAFNGDDNVAAEFVDCTISGNRTAAYGEVPGFTGDADGGAFAVHAMAGEAVATLDMTRSLAFDNECAADGVVRGGMASARASSSSAEVHVNVINSTISENRCDGSSGLGGNGGGFFVATGNGQSRVYFNVSSATMTGNLALGDATSGGAVYLDRSGAFTQVISNVQNTIITDNDAGIGPDCYTESTNLVSKGYNLVSSDANCSISGDQTGNILNVKGKLELLLNNGGPTLTHGLLPDSPAIDAGDPEGCFDHNLDLLEVDQRGYPRVEGLSCDMGAVEQE